MEGVKFNYLLDYKNLSDARSWNVSDGDITFLDLIRNKTSNLAEVHLILCFV